LQNEDLIKDVSIDQKFDFEWADLYHFRIISSDYINDSKIDEFEWCFFVVNSAKYMLVPKIVDQNVDYSIPEEMETRAMKINRDIFATASKHEKKLLEKKIFIPTKYILDYRCRK